MDLVCLGVGVSLPLWGRGVIDGWDCKKFRTR